MHFSILAYENIRDQLPVQQLGKCLFQHKSKWLLKTVNPLTLVYIMLKNGQTYFKNFVM